MEDALTKALTESLIDDVLRILLCRAPKQQHFVHTGLQIKIRKQLVELADLGTNVVNPRAAVPISEIFLQIPPFHCAMLRFLGRGVQRNVHGSSRAAT
jgi:hypothetical protein